MFKCGAFIIYLDALNATDFQDLENAVKCERDRRCAMSELSITEKCLVKCGQHIAAIKEFRARTNSGLKDAKDACDAYRRTVPGWFEGSTYDETTNTWVLLPRNPKW